MKKKLFLGAILTTTAILGVLMTNTITNKDILSSFVAKANSSWQGHYDYVDNDDLDAVLPEQSKAVYEEGEWNAGADHTIKFFHASKHNDFLIRLNFGTTPSYFKKVEMTRGIESFTINLNYGAVDVLIGYEEDVYNYQYTIDSDNLNKNITIPTEGNYFKIVNKSTSTNALVRSFTLNYGCVEGTEDNAQKGTLTDGNNATVHANRGTWYRNKDSEVTLTSATINNNEIVAVLGAISSSGKNIRFRYEAINASVLSNSFIISFDIVLSEDGHIKRGANEYDLVANEKYHYDASRTVKDDTGEDTTIVNVQTGNLTITISNILIKRSLA